MKRYDAEGAPHVGFTCGDFRVAGAPHVGVTCGGFGVASMPKGLKRYYGRGDLHFLTFSCYRRLPLLGTVGSPNGIRRCAGENPRALSISVGWIRGDARARALADQRAIGSHAIGGAESFEATSFARSAKEGGWAIKSSCEGEGLLRFWQPRFYDFNVYSAKKRREKLEYMHANPVTERVGATSQ